MIDLPLEGEEIEDPLLELALATSVRIFTRIHAPPLDRTGDFATDEHPLVRAFRQILPDGYYLWTQVREHLDGNRPDDCPVSRGAHAKPHNAVGCATSTGAVFYQLRLRDPSGRWEDFHAIGQFEAMQQATPDVRGCHEWAIWDRLVDSAADWVNASEAKRKTYRHLWEQRYGP